MDFGAAEQRDLLALLALFDKLAPIKGDIEDKFRKASDRRKKGTSSLPTWTEMYHLGNLANLHKVPKINEKFCQTFR